MSGAGLVSEGHKDGQVGSSAMPHKVNARSSERINGLSVILKGYLSMVSEISGDQWNEGDVSCSVVRRVALPDAFFSLDGIFQTLATILREMNVFEDVVRREVEQELPFVSTTRLLSEAIKQGMGREDAHRLIQGHALAAKDKVQHGERVMFVDDLASDGAFPLNRDSIQAIMDEIVTVNPVIEHQISRVMKRIDEVHSSQNDPSFIWHEIR
jgi:adenylosuccinate lyase